MVFFNQFFQRIFGCFDFCLIGRSSRINDGGIQYFSGLIHHSQLTSGTKSRIPSENYFAYDWRLHEKLFQILTKYLNGTVLRFLSQITADFPLDSRCDQTLVAVLHHSFQYRSCMRIVFFNHLSFQPGEDFFFRCIDLNGQYFFFFSPVESQHTVTCHFCDRLFKFIIHLIYR